jgi:hypothetical protein
MDMEKWDKMTCEERLAWSQNDPVAFWSWVEGQGTENVSTMHFSDLDKKLLAEWKISV